MGYLLGVKVMQIFVYECDHAAHVGASSVMLEADGHCGISDSTLAQLTVIEINRVA
jgi:hypothetical protein